MSYELTRMEPEGVARLAFHGESSRQENEHARAALARFCAETGVEKVLVDLTEVTSFMGGATLDLHFFGASFPSIKFPPALRLAVLTPPKLRADVYFMLTVAWNRSFTMEMSDDRGQVMQWLLR